MVRFILFFIFPYSVALAEDSAGSGEASGGQNRIETVEQALPFMLPGEASAVRAALKAMKYWKSASNKPAGSSSSEINKEMTSPIAGPSGQGGGKSASNIDPNKGPSTSGQGANISAAKDLASQSSDGVRKEINSAREQREQHQYNRQYESSAASEFIEKYQDLDRFLGPREANPDPRVRDEAMAKLREKAKFSPRFQSLAEDVGLHTNADVRAKVPDYVQRLSEDMDRQARAISDRDKDIARAESALQQLTGFQGALGQRGERMSSVSIRARQHGSLTSQSADADDSARGQFPNVSPRISSKITMKVGEDLAGSESHQRARKPASILDSASDATAGKVIDPRTGMPAMGERLRELLRRRFEASENKEGLPKKKGFLGASEKESGEKTIPKSDYSQFFERASAEGSPDKGSSASSPFFLAGPDTDRAVARLVSGLDSKFTESQGANERIFGNVEMNIFERMRIVLRKAERDGRVAKE